MTNNPLKNRLGIQEISGKPINNDFPKSAKIALSYVVQQFIEKGLITSTDDILLELKRGGRFTNSDLDGMANDGYSNWIASLIARLDWQQVLYFCERLYIKYLTEMIYIDGTVITQENARQRFSEEINLILEEENLSYHFKNGLFYRRGRAQTQKSFDQVGTVLNDPRLENVRKLYNKARKSFEKLPEPDYENCVKDAICSLEVCIEILTSKQIGKDFSGAIRRLEGNGPTQIPSPLGESMVKLHSYRGSGTNIAHGTIEGSKVTALEAEFVLNLVASFITYLVDLIPLENEIPF